MIDPHCLSSGHLTCKTYRIHSSYLHCIFKLICFNFFTLIPLYQKKDSEGPATWHSYFLGRTTERARRTFFFCESCNRCESPDELRNHLTGIIIIIKLGWFKVVHAKIFIHHFALSIDQGFLVVLTTESSMNGEICNAVNSVRRGLSLANFVSCHTQNICKKTAP